MKRRNPDGLPRLIGTPKQVAWAEQIRAEAIPVIEEWLRHAEGYAHRCQTQLRDWRRRGQTSDAMAVIYQLEKGLRCDSAKFWIDSRSCQSQAEFLSFVERIRR